MSDPPSTRPRRRPRWLLRGFIALVLLALLAVCVLALMGKVAQSRWEKMAAEIRASGQPLTLDEVLASRPAIPPEEDGGPIIQAALEEMERLAKQMRLLYLAGECVKEFPKRLDANCVEQMREYLRAHRSMLDGLAMLLEYPEARLQFDYANEPGKMKTDLLIGLAHHVAKTVDLDAVAASLDGDYARVRRDIELMCRLSEALHVLPGDWAYRMALATDALAFRSLAVMVQLPGFPADMLEELPALCPEREAARDMYWMLLGQRAIDLKLIEWIGAGGFQVGSPTVLPSLYSVPLLKGLLLADNRVSLVRFYSRTIAASGGPLREFLPEAEDAEDDLKADHPLNLRTWLARVIAPGLTNAAQLGLHAAAESRCAIALLAAERYRLANGAFPTELSGLGPAFLDAVPADPFDDKPLRLRHEDDGALMIYSIGENEVDDGGLIDAPRSRGRAPDVGFRLLPPDRRALPKIE